MAAEKVSLIFKQGQASQFPFTYGTLTRAELLRDPTVKAGDYFHPMVNYSYEVDGRPTGGQQYRFGYTRSLDETEAAVFHERFQIGARVKVFYNPQNPHDSALVVGI